MSLAAFLNPSHLISRFNILELNLTQQLKNIKTPTLVLWGRHDGINTIEMGMEAFESLGAEEKNMVIFENSGHQPFIDEPDAFTTEVLHLVEERMR